MKKYLLKGLAVCTFVCTVIAFPSWARVCFVASDVCDASARGASDETTCEEYKANGNYFDAPVEGRACSRVNVPLEGCVLYDCPMGNCRAQGFDLGPTDNAETRPLGKPSPAWSCNWCMQGTKYWWTCVPGECDAGYTTEANANCEDGTEWREDSSVGRAGNEPCGKCVIKNCPDDTTEEIKPGCYTCIVDSYLDNAKSKACYRCYQMSEAFVTSASKEELGDSCYTFEKAETADEQGCYKPIKRTCGGDEYLVETTLENGKSNCVCEKNRYTLNADAVMRYPAAGGAKTNNVTSLRIGEETIEWPYSAPTSVGDCSIVKSSDGKTLTVSCPANATTTEKTGTFTLTQENNGVLVNTFDVQVIIEPDACPSSEYTYGETPSPAEGYTTVKTDAGGNCYMLSQCEAGYSTAFQDVNSCTKNGHPEGWNFESKGMSGNLVCGKCTPKVCTGMNREVQCSPTPLCQEGSQDCGYKDLVTEYEGDTPKYDGNKKTCEGDGYMWTPEGCKPVPCPEGFSTAYPDINACTKNGHPEGWNYESNGKSGDQVCGRCSPKVCTGMGRTHKCTPGVTPVCNEAEKSCGYKDFVVEYEGDEGKISFNDKDCPTGSSTIKSTEKCVQNNPNGYYSGNDACYETIRPNTDCPKNYSYSYDTCKCECQLKDNYPWKVSSSCELVCSLQEKGNWKVNTSKCEYYCPLTCNEDQKLDAENCVCVEKGCPQGYSNTVTGCMAGYRREVSGRFEGKECARCVENCEVGDGLFGSACCQDKDCSATSEFPLYCFNAPSEDGRSAKSCRECGSLSDCKQFDKDKTRFEQKCALRDDCGSDWFRDRKRSSKWPNGRMVKITRKGNQYIFTSPKGENDSDYDYTYESHTVACRYGECVTYGTDYYSKDPDWNKGAFPNGDADRDDDDMVEAAAHHKSAHCAGTKAYPSKCANNPKYKGTTAFGSFCWGCD